MKKLCFVLGVWYTLWAANAWAQVPYGGIPESAKSQTDLYTKRMASFETRATPVIPRAHEPNQPLYVGTAKPLVVDCMKEVPEDIDGFRTVLVKIRSAGALGISVCFDDFRLSEGTRVFFHANGNTYGNYNYRNMALKKSNSFLGPRINGDECIVEINIPAAEWDQNHIRISSVYHYVYSLEDELDLSCNIDVNCAEGDAWCNPIRGVAIFEGKCKDSVFHCSGSLVNNVNQDFKQYFLTARHCTNCIDNWDDVRITFNYQRSSCDGGLSYMPYYSVLGADPVTHCDVSWTDNALVLIQEPIPTQFNVYYNGVDITARNLYDNVHTIHHPQAGPKIITAGQIQYFAGPKWDVYWDDGALAGGSSGAPVFLDDNQRIIAGISGGVDYDCSWADKHDWVGKVRDCANIEDELFKTSGTESFGGIDPILACQDHLELYGQFADARQYRLDKHKIRIQAQNTINISSVAESYFYPSGIFFDQTSNYDISAGQRVSLLPGTHVYKGAVFSARIAPCDLGDECGINYFKSAPLNLAQTTPTGNFGTTLYPNPTSGEIWILIAGTTHAVQFELLDAVGTRLRIQTLPTQGEPHRLDLSSLTAGIYFIRIKTGPHTETKRVVLLSR